MLVSEVRKNAAPILLSVRKPYTPPLGLYLPYSSAVSNNNQPTVAHVVLYCFLSILARTTLSSVAALLASSFLQLDYYSTDYYCISNWHQSWFVALGAGLDFRRQVWRHIFVSH